MSKEKRYKALIEAYPEIWNRSSSKRHEQNGIVLKTNLKIMRSQF